MPPTLPKNHFIAPSGDQCMVWLGTGTVIIQNLVKRIQSDVTFEQARQAAVDYPDPRGWVRVVRLIDEKQGKQHEQSN